MIKLESNIFLFHVFIVLVFEKQLWNQIYYILDITTPNRMKSPITNRQIVRKENVLPVIVKYVVEITGIPAD